MIRDWKRKGNPSERPSLFCPKCGRCMYTREDVRSRDDRGYCFRCSEFSTTSEHVPDVVTIVLGEGA